MMGCIQSIESRFPHCACCYCRNSNRETVQTKALINEAQVDLSHFSNAKEILGIGGFGIVRRIIKVTCADANVNYAMKSMAKATILSRPNGTSAVLTELKALIAVRDCEFICKIHYAFQDPSFLYLVLEFAAGADMRYNLRKAPHHRFSESLSRLFVRQVFFALQHCHHCSILHRDIKPENVLLFSNGRIKLSDFGVAKILPDVEYCRSTSGTHGYMAPEIYTSEHVHGTAFDWFCTGITLHEFLTGRRPFEAFRLQRYLTQNSHSCDRLALDYLAQMMPAVTPTCLEFMQRILHPLADHRLGARGRVQAILSHPWMIAEPPTLALRALEFVQQELPSFRELVASQAKIIKGSMGSSRVNLSKEEATAILRQHQQAYVISSEIQSAFQEFDFNTKIVPPLRTHSRRKSRRVVTLPSSHPPQTAKSVGSMSTTRDSSVEHDHYHHYHPAATARRGGLDLDAMDADNEDNDFEGEDEYEVRSPRRSITMGQGGAGAGGGGGGAGWCGQGLVAIRRVGLCSPPVSYSAESPSSVVMDPSACSSSSPSTAVAAGGVNVSGAQSGPPSASVSPTTLSNRGMMMVMDGSGGVGEGRMNMSMNNQKVATIEMKYL